MKYPLIAFVTLFALGAVSGEYDQELAKTGVWYGKVTKCLPDNIAAWDCLPC